MRCAVVWFGLVLQGLAVDSAVPVPASVATGQSTKQPTAVPSDADYGPAFERLVKLGVLDTKGATYVKLTLHGKGAAEVQYQIPGMMGAKLKTKGNAWLLPQSKGANTKKDISSFIYRGFEKLTVKQKVRRSSLARLLVGEEKPSKADGDVILGGWKDQDVGEDAKKILSDIDLKRKKDGFFDADQWKYDDSSARWCARVLVAACQMYRAGHHDEANQITGRLFSVVPEPIVVVDQVVNSLADLEYQRLVDIFFKSKNWTDYHQGTKELVERFSRGWKSREGAQLLLTHLDKQLKGVKPELKSLKGVSLKPEAVAVMDDWLGQTKPIVVNPPMCWLLGMDLVPTNDSYGYGGRSGEEMNPEWMKKLGSMGMDGFIALTAVAADDSLIATSINDVMSNYYGGYSRHFSSSSDSGQSPAQKQYAAMSRPCSRGEIARKVILQTLPDSENELKLVAPAELQSVAYQWWLKHRADTPSVLAKHFMEAGNSSQRSLAITALIKSNNESDAMVVEKYVLGSEKMAEQYSTVQTYLKARRGKAKSFFAAYSKALKDEVGEVADDDYENWQIRQAGGVDKYLKKLEIYVNDVSVDKVLSDMKSGKVEVKEGFAMLEAAMEKGTLRQYLTQLISMARQQKSQKEQVEVLNLLYRLVYSDRAEYMKGDKWDAYTASLPALIEKSKDDWSYFLNLTEPFEKGVELGNAPSPAAGVSWVIEAFYFPDHEQAMMGLAGVMSRDELWKFMIARANRVLAGEGLDQFPNAEKVDEAQRKEIREKLSTMGVVDIAKYHDKLGVNEKLAWYEILNGFDDDVPDGVKGLEKIITKIDWSMSSEVNSDFEAKLKPLVMHQKVDGVLIEKVQKLLFTDADHYSDVVVSLNFGRNNIQGQSLYLARGKNAKRAKRSILRGMELDGLVSGKLKKLSGVIARKDSNDKIMSLMVDPEDAKETKKSHQQVVEKLAKAEESEDRMVLFFFAETAESYKKQKEEEAKEEAEDE